MNFHLVMAAREIGAFPVIPLQHLLIKILLLHFDALRRKPSTYDDNKF